MCLPVLHDQFEICEIISVRLFEDFAVLHHTD